MQICFLIFLFILGACFGSFLCCQARRLRLKETKKKALGSRSVCLSCHKKLKWYDNLPIISWLVLRGKCRYCHKKIGPLEILAELGVGLAFLMLGTTIDLYSAGPFDWAILIFTFIFALILSFLAIYDGAYGELPGLPLALSIICAVIILSLKEWAILSISPFSLELVYKPLISILILGGLYLILYLISKGKWVGDGDWLLGLAIGLALFEPWLALITLFLANFIASLIMLPFVRKIPSRKIFFGPFLVIAFIISTTFSQFVLSML